jgi:nucleotidyltransferase/DNA polymerase involved in DNA repair
MKEENANLAYLMLGLLKPDTAGGVYRMKQVITKSESLRRLQTLRNIGIATAERLYAVGIKTPEEVKEADPEKLYELLKTKEGGKLDRCVLYQLRGAALGLHWPVCKDLGKRT